MPITVKELAIAPVKGMRLQQASELELTETGPKGDRAFVLVDEYHALVQTSRTPKLMQVAPSYEADGRLAMRFPDGSEITQQPESAGAPVTTALYNGRPITGRLVTGPLGDALSTHLGKPVSLVAVDPEQTGADDFPVTLMSTATLGALGEALDPPQPPDPRRFRMTITVDGASAWEEHGWSGREVAIGDEVALRIVDPVPRCVVTTRDPDSGKRDVPVLKALANLRGKNDVTFGVWCEVARPGVIRRGDTVAPGPA
jgi:uncharacterized protein YcbX